MAASERPESEASSYESVDGTDIGLISPADLDSLRLELSEKCSVVNCYLLSCKEPKEKRSLVENTIQDLLSAFNKIAAAYDRLNTSCLVVNGLNSSLQKTIREAVAVSVSGVIPQALSGAGRSFAEVTARSTKSEVQKVKISNGPTVIVPATTSFVIGPKKDCNGLFNSSEDTRKALMKAVKPDDVNLKVAKVLNSRNNAVRIVAENADITRISASSALSTAGLEVKMKEKLNPRLIIRGVPTDTTSSDLLEEICAMNSSAGCTNNNLKIIYRYPPRDSKSTSSVVIETISDVRRGLLSQGRVYLSWQSCKVEDHLRLLQCFRCQGFGHLAKNCSLVSVCGHCNGQHITSTCTKTELPSTCHNCIAAKLSNFEHRAFDASKCPIIRQRLTEKAKNISY